MSKSHEHIPDDVLSDYADDPQSAPNRSAIEAHLASCAACWTKLDDLRSFVSALRDEDTWWAAEEMAGGEAKRALIEYAERLQREDVEAARMLRDILESQYVFANANIARKQRLYTGGVVRLLTKTAREECDRDPRFALALAETAAVIAEGLPSGYYPGEAVNELRGTAWKEYSTACRYLGRFKEAWDALERAERAYQHLLNPGLQLANVLLGRAIVLWDQQRYDEALGFARPAVQRFSDLRETERYVDAKEVEAMILHRMGEVSAACATYLKVFETADFIDDPKLKARAARNLGVAYVDLGDAGAASKCLLIALDLYKTLGQRAMVVKTRWWLAKNSLVSGNAVDAANRFPSVIADLTEFAMSADAARAQLDFAEALLVLDRFDEVLNVCSALVSFFRNANMLTGALTAAAFLKEAAASSTLKRDHFAYVRRYLDALERAPDLAFVPPVS